jgi:hypothetical protein
VYGKVYAENHGKGSCKVDVLMEKRERDSTKSNVYRARMIMGDQSENFQKGGWNSTTHKALISLAYFMITITCGLRNTCVEERQI